MAYQYNPPPGPPLNPGDYQVIGPNGIKYGQQEGYEYNPTTDKYDPEPEKKPGVGSTLGPVAAAAGAVTAGQIIANPDKLVAAGKTVKDAAAGVADWISAPFAGPETVAATTPTVAAGSAPAASSLASSTPFSFGAPGAPAASAAAPSAASAPFSVGAPAAAAEAAPSLASSAPFSFAPGAPPAAPTVVSATATPTAAASTGGMPFAPSGGLTAAGYAAGAQTGYLQYKGLKAISEGNAPSLMEGGALFFVDGGASLAAAMADKLGFNIGHSEDYYHAKDRANVMHQLKEGGNLSFNKEGGGTYDLSANSYKHDPLTYNYDPNSPTHEMDIGAGRALAYLLAGEAESTRFQQLAQALATAHANGVSAQEMFQQMGMDYNTGYAQIAQSDLKEQQKNELLNGIDQAFSANAYQGQKKPVKTSAPPVPTPAPTPPGATANVVTGQTQSAGATAPSMVGAKPLPIVRGGTAQPPAGGSSGALKPSSSDQGEAFQNIIDTKPKPKGKGTASALPSRGQSMRLR